MFAKLKGLLKKNKCINSYVIRRNQKKYESDIAKRKNTINDQGSDIVKAIEAVLDDSELVYFATCGTLLGLIREGQLLKNDYDLDYAILVNRDEDWVALGKCLNKIGYKKIRDFSLDGTVTEETYRNDLGVEIDFFGHFIKDGELCFYSYDKLESEAYPSEELWTAYLLRNGEYCGTKKYHTKIGVVTVPENAEEYLTYNYNDNWRIPDPDFKANTGKGCSLIEDHYGRITIY